MSLLPKMTPEANRVHVIRSIENNDGDFNAMAMCKGSLKTIDYLMRREPIYGLVFLLDLKYCQLSYLLSFTPSLTKNLMRCIDVSINNLTKNKKISAKDCIIFIAGINAFYTRYGFIHKLGCNREKYK